MPCKPDRFHALQKPECQEEGDASDDYSYNYSDDDEDVDQIDNHMDQENGAADNGEENSEEGKESKSNCASCICARQEHDSPVPLPRKVVDNLNMEEKVRFM